LHHIIIRRIKQRKIFLNNKDREDFLDRLEKLLPETQTSIELPSQALPAGRQAGFKPALVRRNVRFKTVLLNTAPMDSIKRTAKPGLGQGLER